jgi:hypothetical protein
MDTDQVRCPDCRKRLLDIEHVEGERFRLLIVCRCRQRFRIELPNAATGDGNLPSSVSDLSRSGSVNDDKDGG